MLVHVMGSYEHQFARRIILRLDNGSVIGDKGVLLRSDAAGCVLLEAQQASECNRLGQQDIDRLKKLVDAAAPPEPPLANGIGPAAAKQVAAPEVFQPPSKRQRTSEGAVPREALAPAPSLDWNTKCIHILQQVLAQMGGSVWIFRDPVDAKAVPDYYRVIKSPMTLGQIDSKLKRAQYGDPSQFCEDVRLVWANCRVYNSRESDVGKLGLKLEGIFEELWAGSGLATDATRARRATAGLAADKYDPFDQPPAKARSGPARSGQRTAPGGPKRARDIDRTKSHEVTSGAAAGAPLFISTERLQEMVTMLQELAEEDQQEVIDLINDEAKALDEEGELELNFEKATQEALQRMDLWFKRKAAPAVPARSAEVLSGRRGGSVRLEVDSDSEPESDNDSDDYNSDDE